VVGDAAAGHAGRAATFDRSPIGRSLRWPTLSASSKVAHSVAVDDLVGATHQKPTCRRT
jgi:hypothetical protein